MGLESAAPSIGGVNPSSLIGLASPVVEPRSTAMLTDAFRQGVITADDITQRVGELGKLKQKAEIMGLSEQMSPQAQAARAAAQQASLATNTLAGAQAGAALPGVPGKAAAAEEDVEFHRAATAYGPEAIQAYFKYAPLVPGYDGTPKTSDGKPDWMTVAREGANLSQQIEKKAQAALRATVHGQPQTVKEGALAYTIEKNSVGEDITDPAKKQALNSQATTPLSFKFIKPGGVSVPAPDVAPAAPVVTPIAAAVVVSPEARARVAGIVGTEKALSLTDAEVAKLDAPAPAVQPISVQQAPVVKPTVEPSLNTYVPGKGVVVSIEPEKPNLPKAPTEAQQRAELALARFAQSDDMLSSLKQAGYDPTSIGSWMSGMLPQLAKTGDRKQYEAAVDAWSQGLLRLESGAAISRQEKTWYDRAFFPQVNDPEKTVLSKEAMRHDIERMVAEIAQAGGVVSPESAAQVKKIYAQAGKVGTPGKSAGGVLTLPTGRKIQRDANGNYFEVK